MGSHVPRTAADEIVDARKALDAAFAEMANWRAHLDLMASHPLDSQAIGPQASRSARIVDALIKDAAERSRAAERLNGQLTVVS